MEKKGSSNKAAPHNGRSQNKKKGQIFFSRLNCFKYDNIMDTWKEHEISSKSSSLSIKELSLVTWNVLFDLYIEEGKCDADIIGLQEVTQKFLIMILREKWVQSQYFVSDYTGGYTIVPYGQVILSKYPFSILSHKYSGMKKVIVGEFQFNQRTLYLPVVHLTSDRNKDTNNLAPFERRVYQLDVIYEKTCPSITSNQDNKVDTILIGDFNFHYQEEQNVIREDFKDVWITLHNGKRQSTLVSAYQLLDTLIQKESETLKKEEGNVETSLNKEENATQESTSDHGNKKKKKEEKEEFVVVFQDEEDAKEKWIQVSDVKNFDRILIRSSVIQPAAISLLGTQRLLVQQNPPKKVFPSDHFGLFCKVLYS